MTAEEQALLMEYLVEIGQVSMARPSSLRWIGAKA